MKQIIYISRANREFSDPELEELLQIARIKNAARGVTGMLVYSKGSFLQVLEGPPSKVDEVYNKVEEDRRHRNVVLLKELSVREPCFPDWKMGFKRLTSDRHTPRSFFELTKPGMSKAANSNASEELVRFIKTFAKTRVDD